MRARKKAKLRALYPHLYPSPPPPPEPELPLREDLLRGMRTPRFRTAALRQVILLAGVFVLGWPALEIALCYVLEAFLFLTLRAAAEITLDERYGVSARSPAAVAWQLLVHWLVAAPFIGMLVFGLGAFAILPAFPGDAWAAFLVDGRRDPSFLGGLCLLVGSIVFDTALFARRVAAGRGEEERARDDLGIRLALAKVAGLGVASFWLGLFAHVGLGPHAVTVGIAGAMLYVEAVPRRAVRPFEPSPR